MNSPPRAAVHFIGLVSFLADRIAGPDRVHDAMPNAQKIWKGLHRGEFVVHFQLIFDLETGAGTAARIFFRELAGHRRRVGGLVPEEPTVRPQDVLPSERGDLLEGPAHVE